jgi:hypothetical protein
MSNLESSSKRHATARHILGLVLVIALAAWVVANPVQTGHLLRQLADFLMFLVSKLVTVFTSAIS